MNLLSKHYHFLLRESQLSPNEFFSSESDFQIAINEKLKNNFTPQEQKRLYDEFFSAGPLEELIKNPLVSEIMVNKFDSIHYEENGQIRPWNDHFASPESYKNFIHRLLLEANKKIDEWTPFCDGVWKNFRLHLIHPPLSKSFTLTLRRKKTAAFHLKDFSSSPKVFDIVTKLIHQQASGLIVGTTNSGKTSFLNSCLKLISVEERLISIEDTDEIILPHNNCVKLLTRNSPNCDMPSYLQDDLVKQSLRMRPDRILLGEIRYKEAKDFILALSTGHSGSLATLHASSAQQALSRLEVLIQMGAPHWNWETIRKLIKQSIHFIIVLKKNNGKRIIQSIQTVSSLEPFGFLLEDIYSA